MEIKKNIHSYKIAADIILGKGGIALTGAGISTESGIPDFRSPYGIWSKYNVEEYGHINNFLKQPQKIWQFLNNIKKIITKAKPNIAHELLAKLQKKGYIKAIITQNIDNLHIDAGSKNILELHGNYKYLVCLSCKQKFHIKDSKVVYDNDIPYCPNCKKILKPNVVFFGENLSHNKLQESISLIEKAEFLLVIGTSLMVAPVSTLPESLPYNKWIIEINTKKSTINHDRLIFLQGKASYALTKLWKYIKEYQYI